VFADFTTEPINVNGVSINVCRGGEGPPVLLLHGYPQSHAMWHSVAPELADQFSVVCPDLRGYGDSDKPFGDADHVSYSKRTMAMDNVEVMRSLGFERFAVAGHDRGGRVALRMALDYPVAVSHLAVLDIVPTKTIYDTIDRRHAATVWRYFYLIQPFDLPEQMIGASPEWYLRWTLDEWCQSAGAPTEEAIAEYVRCFDQATIHASCEDYRAGATIDLADDATDADRRLQCPTLVLWSKTGLGSHYDVARIWSERAENPRCRALDGGHFLAEERPDKVAHELLAFLSDARS
jgi:haloacetate dehalogenase